MKPHVLVIMSIYPEWIENHHFLNQEVRSDAETIKTLFTNTSELIVPAGKLSKRSRSQSMTEINRMIDSLVCNNIKKVHVILNTHGAPGNYDLDNLMIIQLIKSLSLNNIKIDTLYALLCDGFKKTKSINHNMTFKTMLYPEKSECKRSSMESLRNKLNRLETKIEQSFYIKGFDKAYDPEYNKEDVINLLRGMGGHTLSVRTQKESKADVPSIRKSIEICRRGYLAHPNEYEKAANVLGIVLHKMNHNIKEYLCGNEALSKGSHGLFQAVTEHNKIGVNPSAALFQNTYKHWLRDIRLSDPRRLKVLIDYCNACAASYSPIEQGLFALKHKTLKIDDLTHQRHKKEATRPDRFFSYHEKTRLLDRTPAHPYNASAIVLYNPPPPCDSLGV